MEKKNSSKTNETAEKVENQFVVEELPGFDLALLQGHDEAVFVN